MKKGKKINNEKSEQRTQTLPKRYSIKENKILRNKFNKRSAT